jgi:very-short-patch-repair endonuclease
MAAVLACGRGAAVSHESAAALWGIIPRDFATHVSLPPGRQPTHPRIKIHRRGFVPDGRWVDRICTTSALETLVDLAAARSENQLARLVDSADRINLINLDYAADRLGSMRRRPGAAALRTVLLGHDKTDSDLEVDFLALVERAGLPKPRTQQKLLGFRVDFFWPDFRLVVETDGLTYHRTRAQQARDRKRDQRLTAAGYTCLRFTEDQVRRHERAVAATLGRVMSRRRLG